MNSYSEKIDQQVSQYEEQEIHDLPEFSHYWSNNFILPRCEKIMEVNNIVDFYAQNFSNILQNRENSRLLSIGSGDCNIEIEIVQNLLKRGHNVFTIECLELSPILIERAKNKIVRLSLEPYFKLEVCDINSWTPTLKYNGIMANHSLHHLVELEHIFDAVVKSLTPTGRFITCDMIGRNGHMRWPEILEIINGIWAHIPKEYKFNSVRKHYEENFINLDCSTVGFEGIRAQDILKLLIDRFSFHNFLSYGALSDIFVERTFGPNLNARNPRDCQFIKKIQEVEDRLIDAGEITPTVMMAIMSIEKNVTPKIWKNRTPLRCVRNPNNDGLPPRFNLQNIIDEIHSAIPVYIVDLSLSGNSANYLKAGWSYPEDGGCWTIEKEAELTIPLKDNINTDYLLTINLSPYLTPSHNIQSLEVLIGGRSLARWAFIGSSTKFEDRTALIRTDMLKDKSSLDIVLQTDHPRIPKSDNSPDERALGSFVKSITLSTSKREYFN